MCVYLSACLSVFFLSATRHLSTLRRCLREQESRSRRRERARARGQAHAQRVHARACRTTSQRKSRCTDAFQKQNRTRAHAVVYVTAEIFKKREKENQHATSQVQFTVCLLLECLLFESYLIFGRSRPWSARGFIIMTKEELQNYGHNKTTTTPETTKQEDFRQPPAHARFTHVHSRTRQFGECHHTHNNSHSTTLYTHVALYTVFCSIPSVLLYTQCFALYTVFCSIHSVLHVRSRELP